MKNEVKVTATVGAYMSGSSRTPADLFEAIERGDHEQIVGAMLTYSSWDMSKLWHKVGDAEITVTLASKDDQVLAAITALRGQLDEKRAEFLQLQSEILERINKLQALEMTVEA